MKETHEALKQAGARAWILLHAWLQGMNQAGHHASDDDIRAAWESACWRARDEMGLPQPIIPVSRLPKERQS